METNTYKKLVSRPKDNFPQYIVIHHSGGTEANPNADTSNHTANIMEAQHLSMGWDGLGYHYVIHNDGAVWKGRPEHYHGAHVKENDMNTKSIGICLAGNFDVTLPTKEQEVALAILIKDVQGRYNIPTTKIEPHRYFLGNPPYKSCFGSLLKDDWARKLVELSPISTKEILLKRARELVALIEQL